MSLPDDAVEARAQGWRTLAALHARIEERLERELRAAHGLSVIEYTMLDVLSRQESGQLRADDPNWHLRMQQLADAVVLSQSATTRLVSRLEDRGLLRRFLCPTDRRGIYTEPTPEGERLLAKAKPTHDTTLAAALSEAADVPELGPLVKALRKLPAPVPA